MNEFAADELEVKFKKKRAAKRALKAFLSVLLVLASLFGVLAGYEEAYAEKFLPGTEIAGIRLGGKTQREAKEAIKKVTESAEKQAFIMTDGQGTAFSTSVKELGMSVDAETALKQAFSNGHKGSGWQRAVAHIKAPFKPAKYALTWKFNDETLEEVVREKAKSLEVAPENASVTIEGAEVKVNHNTIGRRVDINKLIATLRKNLPENVTGRSAPVSVRFDFVEEQPAITTDYAEQIASNIRKVTSEDFILKHENRQLVIPKAEVLTWITVTERENVIEVTLSQENINKSLSRVGKSIEKAAKPKRISAKDGSVLEEGQDGLQIDRSKAFLDISNALALEGEVSHSITLTTSVVSAGEKKVYPEETFTPGLYAGKYIEIDLSKQTLAAFEGSNQYMTARVSTGKWSMPTPTGTFSINNKNPRAYSRRYGLYMPWWMSFIGSEYGLHELPEWPNGTKEGESHLGTPVSHGCVRLGRGSAEQLYNWAQVGTIVYIHK